MIHYTCNCNKSLHHFFLQLGIHWQNNWYLIYPSSFTGFFFGFRSLLKISTYSALEGKGTHGEFSFPIGKLSGHRHGALMENQIKRPALVTAGFPETDWKAEKNQWAIFCGRNRRGGWNFVNRMAIGMCFAFRSCKQLTLPFLSHKFRE
jgi:hypothetical protein